MQERREFTPITEKILIFLESIIKRAFNVEQLENDEQSSVKRGGTVEERSYGYLVPNLPKPSPEGRSQSSENPNVRPSIIFKIWHKSGKKYTGNDPDTHFAKVAIYVDREGNYQADVSFQWYRSLAYSNEYASARAAGSNFFQNTNSFNDERGNPLKGITFVRGSINDQKKEKYHEIRDFHGVDVLDLVETEVRAFYESRLESNN